MPPALAAAGKNGILHNRATTFDLQVETMHSDLLDLQRYHDSGDAGAFQSLVQHHASVVFATARRVTCDPALAEDVVQETFLELARKGRSITESVGAWLHRVAWRRACDAVRAETTRQRYETAALAFDEGRECTWEELEPVFDEALAELVVEERTVIVEHYLEGRTQMEMAGRMGLSQSSVSRLLDQSIQHLRAKLKAKGLLCGAALGAMMIAASSQAAPATLIASLHKIALSSIGGGAATVAGGSILSAMLGLNLKIMLSAAMVLAACAAGYDLASKDSLLVRWFGSKHQKMASADSWPLPVSPLARASDAAATKARLLAEARAIWARQPKFSKEELNRLFGILSYERDPEKRFAAMQAAGMNLSRLEYDRIVARHFDVGLFDERKSGNAVGKLHNDLMAAWLIESPLDAVAWVSTTTGHAESAFRPGIARWVRSHPDAWAAFVEAGPDSRLGDCARLWVEELDDPGSIWNKAKDAGIDPGVIDEGIFEFIETGASADSVFRLIMRCPDSNERSKFIVGISPRLSAEQLLEAASSGLFQDTGLVHLLRAMAGDTTASFADASAWVTKAANGGGLEAPLAGWTVESVGRFYAQWLKVDAQAALQHSVRADNRELLDRFMQEGANSTALNEEVIVKALSSPMNRDRALAAFYQAREGGDSQAALQTIMSSAFVEDQIDAAKLLLTQWTIKSAQGAAAWVASLPASEDRAELTAAVASQWAQIEPEAAFAFAQQQGLGLAHGWAGGLAWGARGLPEDRLAAIFEPLRNDPEYNTMLTRLVGWRCPSSPKEAFAMLSKYAAPGWQTPIINDTIHWLEGEDSRAEGYALQVPTMDLSQIDPQRIAKIAQLLVQRFATQGKLPQALDWTLKLPEPMASQARSEAVSKVALNDARQRTVAEQWIRRAAIPESERVILLQQASQGASFPAGAK